MEDRASNDEILYQRIQSQDSSPLLSSMTSNNTSTEHSEESIITECLNPSLLQRSPSSRTIKNLFLLRPNTFLPESDRPSASQRMNSHSYIESQSLGITSAAESGMKFSPSCIECVIPVPVLNRDDIAEGDHIINAGKVYDHHAIVIEIAPDESDENNKKKAKLILIHATNGSLGACTGLATSPGGKAQIRQTVDYINFETYKIMIVKYLNAPFCASEIISRAVEQLEKQVFKYHLLRNNCEHFATYCVTNERFSVQVRKLSITLQMFFSRGFVGLSDEKRRNQVAHERNLICKFCFERNNQLFAADKKPLQKKSDVHKGDIITFSYWKLYHDAIVVEVHEDKVGNRNEVDLTFVHYAFCGPFSHRTILEERQTFPLDGSVIATIYKCPQFNVYSPDETIERAKMRIGEQQFAFFANDSSHFARWCKLKLSHSS